MLFIMKCMLLAVMNVFIFVLAIVWDMMCKYFFGALKTAYNNTNTGTAAGNAVKAPEVWANLAQVGWIILILAIIGSFVYLIWSSQQEEYEPYQYPNQQEWWNKQ